ncbi:patatin-like phospholipase family protein [Nocardioides sp.]|uniref:patatin-like phospholipase family protein n=1 Tax=Nocardioides sp. TaxID=35761 RepID=UPI002ED46282
MTPQPDTSSDTWIVDSHSLGTALTQTPCPDSRVRPAEPAPCQRPVAVTFSGGGFRATLPALGVVRLLADLGRLADLRYLSSVSGGSVALGLVGAAWPELRRRSFTAQAVDELVIEPAVRRISGSSLKRSLVLGSWRTVGPLTRTELLARRFDDWFFGGLELTALDPEVRWILNSANLASGARFRMERDVLGDYTIGLIPTAETELRLSLAVAASAAVPGAFAPVKLKGLDFPCATDDPALLDGGAYDNTGLQALDGDRYREAFLVSLNAGGLLRPGAYGRIPLVRELARANSLLYRQSTALRTSSMVERFERGAEVPTGEPLPKGARRGVLFALATNFPETGRFAPTGWREAHAELRSYDGKDLALYPTVFDRLDLRLCRTLVYRGWWLAGAAFASRAPDQVPDPRLLKPPEV